MRKTRSTTVTAAALVGLLFCPDPALAQRPPINLADASLEDLMKLEVTSVSKKEQELFRAPSAISVLTAEAIRRSGAQTVPEALRLVPGLTVAQVDANQWAISARGFNSAFADKLLVMIDGRSIYNPIYSGVLWDMEDLALENIERIEVIRGPGAALWGANAVNGVINIISKTAAATQGATASIAAGSGNQALGSAGYGGRLGNRGHYRVYSKYTKRGQSRGLDATPAADDWWTVHAGFRADLALTPIDSLTVESTMAEGTIGMRTPVVTSISPPSMPTLDTSTDAASRSLSVRWTRKPSHRSDLFAQASLDTVDRDSIRLGIEYEIVNLDFQHHFGAGRHDVVWGVGQRYTMDTERPSFALALTPDHEFGALTNVFAQDEITLVPSRVSLTIGSKFEYSNVTGGDVQPNVRLSVTPADRHSGWAAVSQAVRTPSRTDLALRQDFGVFPGPGGMPIVARYLGNPDFAAERVTAYEAGYRVQATRQVQIDVASFYNSYSDLRQLATLAPFVEFDGLSAYLVSPFSLENHARAESRGVESIVRARPHGSWTLEGSHTWFNGKYLGAVDPANSNANTGSPAHQWQLISRLSLPARVELDTTLFRSTEFEAGGVPGYSRLDARLAVPIRGGVTLSVVGQSLLSPYHVEFDQLENVIGRRIPRSGYAKISWQF
jgi:iron complex outermembrane recepter protein